MTLTEALLPYSIENFLTAEETAAIVDVMDRYKATNPERLEAGATGKSVHFSDTTAVTDLVGVYEPQGRIEVTVPQLPEQVAEIVEQAFFRRIEDVRRAYPSGAWPYGFTYVEYSAKQFFTAHTDGLTEAQCAGFGVTLTNDFEGGEFCVETCGSNRLWTAGAGGSPMLAPSSNSGAEWFRQMPRTQWSMRPRQGTAVFYGSALVHASKPVVSGTLKKVIAFISNV
jgi:hypothetical protein